MLPGSSSELSASKYAKRDFPGPTNHKFVVEIPIGRLGKPEEIAETVVFIVKTGYVHNKVIAVDGGMFIQ